MIYYWNFKITEMLIICLLLAQLKWTYSLDFNTSSESEKESEKNLDSEINTSDSSVKISAHHVIFYLNNY